MCNNCLPTAIAEKPYLLDELTYETECVLAILRTINDGRGLQKQLSRVKANTS